jgi:hypothetical protein
MNDRQASILICDDLLISVGGKMLLLGVYNSDIVINADEATIAQLVVLFQLETSVHDPFLSAIVEVKLPGAEPVRASVPMPQSAPPSPDRTRLTIRWPVTIQQAILRPGRIETKVIHERGEILSGNQWVVRTLALPRA